jgi:hypothetical protein
MVVGEERHSEVRRKRGEGEGKGSGRGRKERENARWGSATGGTYVGLAYIIDM